MDEIFAESKMQHVALATLNYIFYVKTLPPPCTIFLLDVTLPS